MLKCFGLLGFFSQSGRERKAEEKSGEQHTLLEKALSKN